MSQKIRVTDFTQVSYRRLTGVIAVTICFIRLLLLERLQKPLKLSFIGESGR
jgi:hypothetical protein